jgi:hypothetical protein
LYARYLTRRQQGESLSFESWCGEHPSEVDDLRRLHGQYRQYEQSKSIFEPLGAFWQDPATAADPTAWRAHLAS